MDPCGIGAAMNANATTVLSDMERRLEDTSMQLYACREALELIAAPRRPDGTWNRDREACRQIAREALEKTR